MSATTNTKLKPYCQYCFDQPFDTEKEYFENEYCNERCKERFEEEREVKNVN
jgi:hypothetical protein